LAFANSTSSNQDLMGTSFGETELPSPGDPIEYTAFNGADLPRQPIIQPPMMNILPPTSWETHLDCWTITSPWFRGQFLLNIQIPITPPWRA
jgi:hypothetical protein